MGIILRYPQPYQKYADEMVDTRYEHLGELILSHNMGPCNSSESPCTTYDGVIHMYATDPTARRSFYHELGHVHHMRCGPPPMPPNCKPAWDNQEGWAHAFSRCAYGDRAKEVGDVINVGMPVWTQVNYNNIAEWFRNAVLLTT